MFKSLRNSATPLMLIILVLSACAHPEPTPRLMLELTAEDRRGVAPPKAPAPIDLAPPHETGAAERAYLFERIVAPLLAFSLAQEAARIAERSRADALVAKLEILEEMQVRFDQAEANSTELNPRPWFELRLPWIEIQPQSSVTSDQ